MIALALLLLWQAPQIHVPDDNERVFDAALSIAYRVCTRNMKSTPYMPYADGKWIMVPCTKVREMSKGTMDQFDHDVVYQMEFQKTIHEMLDKMNETLRRH